MNTRLARRLDRLGTGVPSIFPGAPLNAMRQEFDQMLSNWFSHFDHPSAIPSFSPLLDLTETDSDYRIKVDLPGLRASDLNVQVSDNILTISGERKSEKTEEQKNERSGKEKPHYVERYHGTFSRSVVLPGPVNQDKIDHGTKTEY